MRYKSISRKNSIQFVWFNYKPQRNLQDSPSITKQIQESQPPSDASFKIHFIHDNVINEASSLESSLGKGEWEKAEELMRSQKCKLKIEITTGPPKSRMEIYVSMISSIVWSRARAKGKIQEKNEN